MAKCAFRRWLANVMLFGTVVFSVDDVRPAAAALPLLSVDTSFDGDGVLYQESAQQVIGECAILATKTLPDGSQLSAGCGLIKTVANGFRDSTFGLDGVIAFHPQPTAATIDSAGNAYIFTPAPYGDESFTARKYRPDGSLDPTFGVGGVADQTGLGVGLVREVGLHADGSMTLLTKSAYYSTHVLRMLSNGVVSATYLKDGRRPSFSKYGFEDPHILHYYPDGRVLIAARDTGIVRLAPDGSGDITFGTHGFGGFPAIESAAVRSDGKILVMADHHYVFGTLVSRGGYSLLNANGTLDPTFNGGQVLESGPWSNPRPAPSPTGDPGVSIFSDDGRTIVIRGTSVTSLWGRYLGADQQGRLYTGGGEVVSRWNSDLSPDATYGTNGALAIAYWNRDAQIDDFRNAVVFADGRVRITGAIGLQLTPNGQLDTSYAVAGVAPTVFVTTDRMIRAVHIDPAGRVLTATTTNVSGELGTVRRYLADGSVDPNFGPLEKTPVGLAGPDSQGRTVIINYDSIERFASNGTLLDTRQFVTPPGDSVSTFVDVQLQADDSVLVTGGDRSSVRLIRADGSTAVVAGSQGNSITARQNSRAVIADGALFACTETWCKRVVINTTGAEFAYGEPVDPFVAAGSTALPPPGPAGGHVVAAAFGADGSLSTVVQSVVQGQYVFELRRFNRYGELDPLFGTSGAVVLPLSSAGFDDTNYEVVEVVGSQILVARETQLTSANPRLDVFAFNADGHQVNTFGVNGTATIPITAGGYMTRSVAAGDQLVVFSHNTLAVVGPTGEVATQAISSQPITTSVFGDPLQAQLFVQGSQLTVVLNEFAVRPGELEVHRRGVIRRFLISPTPLPVVGRPYAKNDRARTPPAMAVTVPVGVNDTITSGTATLPRVSRPPSNGTATVLANGSIHYQPFDGFYGVESMQYRTCSTVDSLMCDTAWVYVTVPAPPPALVPVGPVRLFDSRPNDPQGAVSIDKTRYGGARVLRVKVAGVGGVPTAGAAAISLNVTVVGPSNPGWLTVYPCGQQPLVSSLNYVTGQTVPNAVIAPLSPEGDICLFSSAETHVLADLNGWFPAGKGFAAVQPARVVDTRPSDPQGLVSVTKQMYGRSSVLRVRLVGVGGLPATGIEAVALNVTAVLATGTGYVTVYPCGALPTVSSLNFTTGQIVANSVITPVSPDGEVCLYSNVDTHLIIDINGWFGKGSGFNALDPWRMLDTRSGEVIGGFDVSWFRKPNDPNYYIEVLMPAVWDDTAAVSLNVTVVDPDGRGYLGIQPDCSPARVSTLNFDAHQTVPNAAIVPVDTGRFCVITSALSDVLIDINGWFIKPGMEPL